MLSDTVVENHTSSFEFLGDFAYCKIGNEEVGVFVYFLDCKKLVHRVLLCTIYRKKCLSINRINHIKINKFKLLEVDILIGLA